MGRSWGRPALGFAVCLSGLLSATPATAAITASTITAPANGAELFFNGDAGSGSVTVRGTVTGASAGAKGDLRCYTVADAKSTSVASGIDVSSGSFATGASLSRRHRARQASGGPNRPNATASSRRP